MTTGKGRYRVGTQRFRTKEQAERARERNRARARAWIEANERRKSEKLEKQKEKIREAIDDADTGGFSSQKAELARRMLNNYTGDTLTDTQVSNAISSLESFIPDSNQVISGALFIWRGTSDMRRFAKALGYTTQVYVETSLTKGTRPYLVAENSNTILTWKNGTIS